MTARTISLLLLGAAACHGSMSMAPALTATLHPSGVSPRALTIEPGTSSAS